MGKRKGRDYWLQHHANDYLADRGIKHLGFPERGVLQTLWSVALTQTDRPGWFILDGVALTGAEIVDVAREYGPVKRKFGGSRHVNEWVLTVLHTIFTLDAATGAWYSRRIDRQHTESEQQSERGKKGSRRAGFHTRTQPEVAYTEPVPLERIAAQAEEKERGEKL